VEVEWSSLTMDIYGWTTRGPLRMTVVEAVLPWCNASQRAVAWGPRERCLLGLVTCQVLRMHDV
jgi:hypothetical protein